MKLGTYDAERLLRGDVTADGVVLDCIGDGPNHVMVSFRVQGEALAVRHHWRGDRQVEVIGYQDIEGG